MEAEKVLFLCVTEVVFSSNDFNQISQLSFVFQDSVKLDVATVGRASTEQKKDSDVDGMSARRISGESLTNMNELRNISVRNETSFLFSSGVSAGANKSRVELNFDLVSRGIMSDEIGFDQIGEELFEALVANDEARVICMLEAGAPVNYFSIKRGCTPLIWAAGRGLDSIVDIFLEHPDIDTRFRASRGQSASENAYFQGFRETGLRIIDKSIELKQNTCKERPAPNLHPLQKDGPYPGGKWPWDRMRGVGGLDGLEP